MECGKLHGRRRRHLDVVQHDPAIEPRHPTLGIQRPEGTEVALAARVLADLVRVRVRVSVRVRVMASIGYRVGLRVRDRVRVKVKVRV